MTELEKMISQILYSSDDPELSSLRRKALDTCFEYNNILPSDTEAQYRLLQGFLGRIGSNIEIRAPFHCDYGFNISIGENFFSNFNLTIIDCGKVIFGDNVMIGPNCTISSAGHPLDIERRNRHLEYAYTVTIEDNVWIGSDVSILPGITIGLGSVIGAGSIVNRDIPPNSLAVGNPCRVIRSITDEEKNRNWDRKI